MFEYNPPRSPWLDIIYRDNDLLVVNKPAGLLTVPGKNPEHKDSLQARVVRVLPTARIVHRLDMATSGLLLVPLSKKIQGELGKQFEARTVSKRYIAVVQGKLNTVEGTVDLPLRCDWPNRPKQMVDHDEGKQALTHYKVIESPVVDDSNARTRVELTPVTGRSHQLRVHMQQLGHPILGDRLYGTSESTAAAPRLLLHAEQIEFVHPGSGETLNFELPAPF